jgi:hypothetical protein
MMKYFALALSLLFALNAPLAALAEGRGGGGGGARGGGGAARGGGGGGAARGGGGFNLNSDVKSSGNRQAPTTNANRNNNYNNVNRNNNYNNVNRNNNYNNVNRNNNYNNVNRNNNYNNVNRNVNVNNVNVNRAVVVNPVYRGPAWGWNRGVVWAPAGAYWGGGFWGAMAIGVTSAAVYGGVVSANNQTVASYQVQPSSPGATLLSNYGLTQTPCGPPNLVVIYGPNNSVICAYPNNNVSAGSYNLDTSTLSLTST